MIHVKRTTAAAIALLATIPLALAQGAGANFSTEKLEQYAEAQQKVLAISDRYRERIETADSSGKAMDLQQQANQEMVRAVRSSGLSVDEFNEITTVAQDDPSLQAKIEHIIEKQKM